MIYHLSLNLGLTLMPIYYIIICSLKHFGIFYLNNDNNNKGIQCIDESKMIESGKINRIIFDKTGTLTENKIEIVGFIPLYYDNSSYRLSFKIYDKKNIKKICDEHLVYYRNYLINKQNIDENSQKIYLNTSINLKNSLIDPYVD